MNSSPEASRTHTNTIAHSFTKHAKTNENFLLTKSITYTRAPKTYRAYSFLSLA